jgi:hypothetical protein
MGPSGDVMNSLVYWTRTSELHPHFVVRSVLCGWKLEDHTITLEYANGHWRKLGFKNLTSMLVEYIANFKGLFEGDVASK